MRILLNRIYASALWAAGLAMIAIGLLVLIQVLGRVLDRTLVSFGMSAAGITVPSIAEIGGFLFVAAVFLALPATLRAGTHIRVTMLASHLPAAASRVLSILVLAAALALAIFAAWHSGLQALDSAKFGALSYGVIAIPLWIPQLAMTLGLALFAVSLLDDLIVSLTGGEASFVAAERATGPEGGH